MTNEERVAELRAKGLSPKEIARALSLRPAEVSALIQHNAAALAARSDPAALTPLVACLVSPGWPTGLGLHDTAESWGASAGDAPGCDGLAMVVVAREGRYGQVVVASYLVDVFCLGVKSVVGPKLIKSEELAAFVGTAFRGYPGKPGTAPIALAQNLVFGAVDYARKLGFEPASDFARARPHLGEWAGPSLIDFGRDGRPLFVNGPRDDAMAVLATLRRTVGEGNFGYLLGGPPM